MYYTDICFILHLNTTEERVVVWPICFVAPFDDSQRSRQGRYLGEGNCTFGHEEIPAYEIQPEQLHQITVHEYDKMHV